MEVVGNLSSCRSIVSTCTAIDPAHLCAGEQSDERGRLVEKDGERQNSVGALVYLSFLLELLTSSGFMVWIMKHQHRHEWLAQVTFVGKFLCRGNISGGNSTMTWQRDHPWWESVHCAYKQTLFSSWRPNFEYWWTPPYPFMSAHACPPQWMSMNWGFPNHLPPCYP